jgi:hypothetical protein
MPKKNAMAMAVASGEAAAARAAAAKRRKRPSEEDELELTKKQSKRAKEQEKGEEGDEEEEGEEEEEEDEESEGASTASDEIVRDMDVDAVLTHKRKVWEEKELMVLAIDNKLAEAEAKATTKLEVLQKARDNYPTAITVSSWF